MRMQAAGRRRSGLRNRPFRLGWCQEVSAALKGGFEHSKLVTGKQNRKITFEFDTRALDTVKVGPRLIHHSSMALGVAWCDELQLVEVGPLKNR